jgi:hypothetical protein
MEIKRVIENTYSIILKSKLENGFKYGLNDCFMLGALYHYNLTNDSYILDLVKNKYNSETSLVTLIKNEGYEYSPDLFKSRGYSFVDEVNFGDIALAKIPGAVNRTFVINTGNNTWITSTGDPSNDILRIVSNRISLIMRPNYE